MSGEPCCRAHRILAEFSVANDLSPDETSAMLAGMFLATKHPEYIAALVKISSHVDEKDANVWADEFVRMWPLEQEMPMDEQ